MVWRGEKWVSWLDPKGAEGYSDAPRLSPFTTANINDLSYRVARTNHNNDQLLLIVFVFSFKTPVVLSVDVCQKISG